MLSWMLNKALTDLLANNQITPNIYQGKTVEYTKLKKTKSGKKSHRANIKR